MMVIENRELDVGMKLVGTYKGQRYHVTVVEGQDGNRIAYRLRGGGTFKSPSAAGRSVMGGVACNGWRFWSVVGAKRVESTEPGEPAESVTEPGEPAEAAPERKPRTLAMIRRTPNQRGVADGQTRYFCDGCKTSFEIATVESGVPRECPNGHTAPGA